MSAKRGLRPEIKEIVEWAAKYGWTLDDEKAGSGHHALRHKSGAMVTLPATPSDHRGLLNIKADIRRISGVPSDSGPAGKYRHKPRRKSERFDMEAAVREQAEYRERLLAEERERQERDEEIMAEVTRLRNAHKKLMVELGQCDPRREQKRAQGLAIKIVEIERRLKGLGE